MTDTTDPRRAGARRAPAAPGLAGAATPSIARAARPRAALLAGAVALGLAGVAAAQEAPAPSAGPALAIPLAGVLGAAPAAAPAPAAGGGTIPLAGVATAATTPAASPTAATPAPAATAPGDPAGAAPGAPAAGPSLAAADAAAAAEANARPTIVGALWPLDAARAQTGRARLAGERDSADFALFAPDGAAPREFVVSMVSSAFILPQRSHLRVFVGDALIGETPLRSITGLERVRFPLPPGAIRPGLNRVRVETDLAHRLYCGAEASYGLWTDVDLATSGAAAAAGATGAPQAGPETFLAAANAARAAGRPILIRGAGDDDAPRLDAFVRRLGATMGEGLVFAPEGPGAVAGAGDAVIDLTATGGPYAYAYAFAAEPYGPVRVALPTEPGAAPPLGAEGAAGVEAAAAPLAVDAPTPLLALGFQTARVSEHLWRAGVPFRLPADWLISVKDRATLDLDFSYQTGLPAGSVLRVFVNGEAVRIVPLDQGGRFDAEPLEVRFDAGLLRAGRNLIGFEIAMPGDPADQPCLADEVARVELRDASTLTVPSAPRMHMPGLGRWMAGSGPVVVEDLGAAAAAGGLSARLGFVAALPGDGAAAPDAAARRLLVLGPADLSRAAFGPFAVGRQMLVAALRPEGEGAAPQAVAADGPTIRPAGLVVAPDADGIMDWTAAAARGVARLARPDPVADLGDWLGGRRAQALLFQLDPASPDDAYLLLANGANMAEVAAALGHAARRGVPLDGHLAALSWDGTWASWTDGSRLPVLEEPLGRENWRGVVGNFASARPGVFVLLLAATTLVSVLLANSFIRASRRQR